MQAVMRAVADYDRGFLAGLGAAAQVDGKVMDIVERQLLDAGVTAKKAQTAAERWRDRAVRAEIAASVLMLPWVWKGLLWAAGQVAR